MKKKIWIDPGHGGTDSGAVGQNRQEKNDNLRYALELARQFEAQGLEVVLTRREDKGLTYNQRTGMEKGCSLAICCHRNSGGNHPEARGLEIWLHHAASPAVVAWGADTARRIERAGLPLRLGSAAPGVYKGFRTDPNADYYCNSGTRSPSMLVELGFITSPQDNAAFDQDYPKYCAAMVQAACAYLKLPYQPPEEEPQPSEPEEGPLYRVQVGAFRQRENAEAVATELQKGGYQTLIKME